MSDLLVIRDINDDALAETLNAWRSSRQWARAVEVRDGWESRELRINRRNAFHHLRGKHKSELAALVLDICSRGGRVVHVELRDSFRREADLREWAMRADATPS